MCCGNEFQEDLALSTGWFPPVARPINAHIVVRAAKFGIPPPTKPATDERIKVELKASFLPIKSALIGQSVEPTTKPAYFPTVRNAIRLTTNSLLASGLMRVTAWSQNYLLCKLNLPFSTAANVSDRDLVSWSFGSPGTDWMFMATAGYDEARD